MTPVAYAHDGVVLLDYDGDPRAPGGRITAELCGNWDHEPPCPLWPHHTHATPEGDTLRVRILFAAEPDLEKHVRQLIRLALWSGEQAGPDGRVTRWMLESESASRVRPEETDHAARLVALTG